jgi:tetrahydromethanopterin S-methyltransferase subunit H
MQRIIKNGGVEAMFKYNSKQLVYEIGGVKIGSEVGENPTVMIGSIFYKGDKNIRDDKTGAFDKERAQNTISCVEELCDRTGLPAMLDIVCTNAEVTPEYLEFVADATDMPLLIDAVSEEAAIKGIDCAKALGIIDRIVFNSINPKTKDRIYDKIKQIGIKTAILLTFSTMAIISSTERVKLLETMIPKAEAAGIQQILVDTVVLDISTLGLACKAIREVKDRFGFPAGCGAHNAISSWKALRRKKDKLLTLSCSSIANGLPVALGADFILYGPVDEAEYMFPAVSLINAAYGQVLMEGGKRLDLSHPRFRLARL